MKTLVLALLMLTACDVAEELGTDAGPDAAPSCRVDRRNDAGRELTDGCDDGEVCIAGECAPCGAEGQACCHRPLVTWCDSWCDGGTCLCREGVCR